jgi:agmatine/peptidylarginine deiminase
MMLRPWLRSLVLALGLCLLWTCVVTAEPPPYDLRPAAEFERHEGMIIGWYRLGLYPAQADTMWALAVQELREVTTVYIAVVAQWAVNPISSFLTSLGIPLSNVDFLYGVGMESVWIRDYGPQFAYTESGMRVVVEGGYSQDFPAAIASLWGLEHYHIPLNLQGGNYMADGARQVAISSAPVGDPWTWQQTVRAYCDLPLHIMPPLQGEPCGHCDMYTRFVGPDKVVVSHYMDPYYNANMDAAAAEFEAMGFEVFRVTNPVPTAVSLPPGAADDRSLFHLQPGADLPERGSRSVYRSYTNGIQCNGLYLLPTYDSPLDQAALAVFQQALPDHQVVPIRCVAIINYWGALHCTSSDLPADPLPRPETVTVTALGSDVQLTWSMVLGAASYEIFRRAEPMGYAEALDDCVASTPGGSWTDVGALSGTHHAVYQVLAVSSDTVRTTMTPRRGAVAYALETAAGGEVDP